eukprot:gnl/TRDRNA2_/TRDRNA2_181830_c0_seq1.p1 gnl/TRDRNA2_/TRDRNA2_181830_c0~~gnl/TRDRNA2_/TRDRNA2_181830_c0_seq1.p1  ORF type:complete len:326 (+),score=96.98 gnl/TRDRNA2_/TRDRNA2_181830_c0_seq1:82-1059(+)
MRVERMLLAFALILVADAARLQAKQPAEVNHFMSNTYGFLRSTSDNVGSAVSSMLSIQGNMEEMKRDLNGEYALWMKKKRNLADEHDRLASDIAHMQAALDEQHGMREEKLRLQGVLEFQKQKTAQTMEETNQKRKVWAQALSDVNKDITMLEKQIEEGHSSKLGHVSDVSKRTSELRDQNRFLQDQIFHLNEQNVHLETTTSQKKVEIGQIHSGLLAQIDSIQKQIHSFQDEVIAQAQLRTEVLGYRHRVSAQMKQTEDQRSRLTTLQSSCTASLKEIEDKILTAQAKLKNANEELVGCQELDGENQKIQRALNQCKAVTKAGR